MNWNFKPKKVSELFELKTGDYHATKELDTGNVPLISCGDLNNGLVGYYDIPQERCYRHSLTVAYNGQPLLAKFHPYEFGAKDDVAVLIPRFPMETTTLLYLAALLNRNKWRYSYGRKCFRGKLQDVAIPVPVDEQGKAIDQEIIASQYTIEPKALIPSRRHSESLPLPISDWRSFAIADLFDVQRGDFHSIADLGPGTYRTVSRITEDNGTVGYFDRPDRAKVYSKGSITVSTVGGDAFVQLSDFIATDNVLICTPKRQLKESTIFFMVFALNSQRWRYSYGRQPYRRKFIGGHICLPVDSLGNLDERAMGSFVENTAYWSELEPRLRD